ncbi:MAG TPA: NHL repeat-containing protein [Chloroflexia bacterium]|nr:NHL repeat-containing protein [Chloroflexia bacterium]
MSPSPPVMASGTSRGMGAGCGVLLVLFILLTVGLPLYLAGNELFAKTNPPSFDFRTMLPVLPSPTPAFADPVQMVAGTVPGPGAFNDSRAVALDGAGNIYVTDSNPGRVLKFDPQGRFLAGWPAGEQYPDSLNVDRAGNVYLVTSQAIRKYDGATGRLLDTFTFKDDKFGFFGFGELLVLPDGTLLATMGHTGNLVQLDAHGQELRRFLHPLQGHTATEEDDLRLAADAQGILYLLGRNNAAVYKLAADGTFLGTLIGKGDTPGRLDSPQTIAVDAQNRIYVHDSQGIQVFDATGRYLGLVDPLGAVGTLAPVGDGEFFVALRDRAVKYRLRGLGGAPVPTVPPPPTLPPTVPPSGPPTEVPTATPLPAVGGTVDFEGWTISLARAESRPTLVLPKQRLTIRPTGRFYLLWVDARNQQTSPHDLAQSFRWHLQEADDHTYYPLPLENNEIFGAFLQQEGRAGLDAAVPAQGLTHPLLAFDLPEDTLSLQLVIQSALGSSEVHFALPDK